MGDAAIPDQDRLARMRADGAERFDAAGWHYLDTLARRAAQQDGSVRRLLEAKLDLAAAAFAQRFAQARSTAAETLATTSRKHPADASELQHLFASSDFRSMRRLGATLEAREQCAALAALVSQLEPTTHQTSARELKTVRESRNTWARMSVDKQLAQAMKQGPVNAGPINSHMLVLRSLATMQAISPDYLSRIVSYADTLLALAPGEKEAPVKRKKAAKPKKA